MEGRIPPDEPDLTLKDKWLNGVNLTKGFHLANLDFRGSLLDQCDLTESLLDGSDLRGTTILNTKLTGTKLRDVKSDGKASTFIQLVGEFDLDASGAPTDFRTILDESRNKVRNLQVPKGMKSSMMRYIPGGEFLMGTESLFARPHEKPRRRVKVSPFYIDVRPVSNGEFFEFVKHNPEWAHDVVTTKYGIPYYLSFWKNEKPDQKIWDHPVIYVSWYAARAYAKWAGKRLPREAEWEFALRDGNHDKGWDYPHGENDEDGIHGFIKRSVYDLESQQSGACRTLPVKGEEAKNLGRWSENYKLLDMNGNVNEWVFDWFGESYYRDQATKSGVHAKRSDIDPKGPDFGQERIVRGGSYLSAQKNDIHWLPYTTFYRESVPPRNTNEDCGFRCATSTEEYKRIKDTLEENWEPYAIKDS